MSQLTITRVENGYILEYWMGTERVNAVYIDDELLLERLAQIIPAMTVRA
jgi:hypothetical protein